MRATLDHFEIPVADSARLSAFLEEVFGWIGGEFVEGLENSAGSDSVGRGYRRVAPAWDGPESKQRAVRVGLFEGAHEILDRAIPVISLDGETLELCLERVAAAGGQVVLEPMQVASSGRFARFEDPEGNPWGLWERSTALETSE